MNIIATDSWKVKETKMINTLNEKVFNNDKIQKTFDEYSKVDCYNGVYALELKFRNMPSTQYNDCFLEKAKYDAVMERAVSNNKTAGYIAAFTDGSYYAWNLTKLTEEGYEFGWKPISMKMTTHFANNDPILKLSCKLPLSKGVKLI